MTDKKKKAGRPVGRKTTTPRWPATVRQYVVNALATWSKPAELYRELTDPTFAENNGFSGLDPEKHKFDSFKNRCKRIPHTELIDAHEIWQATLIDVRWAGMKDRAQALSDLIDTVMRRIKKADGEDIVHEGAKGNIIVQTIHDDVTQIRMLMEQMRKEVSADADRSALAASGNRVMIANPKAVEITAETVGEMLLMYRQELGGLHNLDMSALTLAELNKLLEAVQCAVSDRIKSMSDASIDLVMEEDDDDEES